jgi:hypothetical protein
MVDFRGKSSESTPWHDHEDGRAAWHQNRPEALFEVRLNTKVLPVGALGRSSGREDQTRNEWAPEPARAVVLRGETYGVLQHYRPVCPSNYAHDISCVDGRPDRQSLQDREHLRGTPFVCVGEHKQVWHYSRQASLRKLAFSIRETTDSTSPTRMATV